MNRMFLAVATAIIICVPWARSFRQTSSSTDHRAGGQEVLPATTTYAERLVSAVHNVCFGPCAYEIYKKTVVRIADTSTPPYSERSCQRRGSYMFRYRDGLIPFCPSLAKPWRLLCSCSLQTDS
jgi:hypothetical protein